MMQLNAEFRRQQWVVDLLSISAGASHEAAAQEQSAAGLSQSRQKLPPTWLACGLLLLLVDKGFNTL